MTISAPTATLALKRSACRFVPAASLHVHRLLESDDADADGMCSRHAQQLVR